MILILAILISTTIIVIGVFILIEELLETKIGLLSYSFWTFCTVGITIYILRYITSCESVNDVILHTAINLIIIICVCGFVKHSK